MMQDKILLSISILISNRPDTVEKCLNSLSSLREKVSCELILTDTGCGEHVRKIVESYADVLLDFTWCNDFSKARNLGLSKAKGEWFLYMDDDEWFEDTKAIEEFFISGAYKDYTKAYYSVRNYRNRQGTHFDDAITPRMAKLGESVRFYNAIHEGLSILPGKSKVLDSYAHHYGYVFETEADKYKHAQRNLLPLLEEYRTNPYNLQYAVQIAQEYNSIREYRKSIEISLEGIENYSSKKTTVLYLNALFINIVERHVRLFLYDDAVCYGKNYLQDERMTKLGRGRILAPMIISLYRLNRFEECAEYVEAYMEIFKDYRQNSEIYQEQSAYMMYGCFTIEEQCDVMGIGTAVNLSLGNYDKAKEIFDYIDIEQIIIMQDMFLYEHTVKAYVKAEGVTKTHPCVMILNKLLEWDVMHPKLIAYFEEERKKDTAFEAQIDKWEYLEGDCWYLAYLQLNSKKEEGMREFDRLWSYVESVLPKSMELGIWEKAESEDIDMGIIIEKLPYYKWRNAVNNACNTLKRDDLSGLYKQLSRWLKEDDCKALYWNSSYYHKQLIGATEDTSEDNSGQAVKDVIDNMISFAQNTIALAEYMYAPHVIEKEKELLPEYMQTAIHMAALFEYTEAQDFANAVKELKVIRELLPDIATAVKIYTKWIETQIKRKGAQEEADRQAATTEMQQLEKAVKAQIQVMLQQGNKEVALQLITQLEAITGNNEELEALKQMAK